MIAQALTSANFVNLYGVTPPHVDAGEDRIRRAASRLAERTRGLDVDGFVVYDVQDESARTAATRPFPFVPMIDPRHYAQLIRDLTGRECLVYKCISGLTEDTWRRWLGETVDVYGIDTVTPVGAASSTSAAGFPLSTAIRIAAEHPAKLVLGGVAIPERHTPERSESRRLLQKSTAGCRYFITQAIYDPARTIALLKDYQATISSSDVPVGRMIMTFTPCGRPETMAFMKWLGISIAADVEARILGSDNPLGESIRTCVDSLRRILDACGSDKLALGINVESVSNKKDEILAAVELSGLLSELAREYRV